VRRYYASFSYRAKNWKKLRRGGGQGRMASVSFIRASASLSARRLPYPRVGFIVRNLARPAERVVVFCNQRGAAEQWIKEGKGAIK
jgi:hypothetical protein